MCRSLWARQEITRASERQRPASWAVREEATWWLMTHRGLQQRASEALPAVGRVDGGGPMAAAALGRPIMEQGFGPSRTGGGGVAGGAGGGGPGGQQEIGGGGYGNGGAGASGDGGIGAADVAGAMEQDFDLRRAGGGGATDEMDRDGSGGGGSSWPVGPMGEQ